MNRIVLHIGSEKTCTTTIQYNMSRQREALAKVGVLYPASLGGNNHMALTAYALSDDKLGDETRVLSGITEHPSLAEFRKFLDERLRQEIADNSPKTLLLSNQHLSSRLRREDEVARLACLLRQYTNDIIVVLYLRNPVDFIASWYSTSVTGGNTNRLTFPLSSGTSEQIDYLRMVDLFENEFGREAMRVRRFDREHLLKGDLWADFLSVAEISNSVEAAAESRNESLSFPALVFLRELNKHIPRMTAPQDLIHCGALLSRLSDDTRAASGLQFLLRRRAKSNGAKNLAHRIISERYFDGDWPLFSKPKTVSKEESAEEVQSFSESVAIAAEIWKFGRRANLNPP